jgi:hypothetical protein
VGPTRLPGSPARIVRAAASRNKGSSCELKSGRTGSVIRAPETNSDSPSADCLPADRFALLGSFRRYDWSGVDAGGSASERKRWRSVERLRVKARCNHRQDVALGGRGSGAARLWRSFAMGRDGSESRGGPAGALRSEAEGVASIGVGFELTRNPRTREPGADGSLVVACDVDWLQLE